MQLNSGYFVLSIKWNLCEPKIGLKSVGLQIVSLNIWALDTGYTLLTAFSSLRASLLHGELTSVGCGVGVLGHYSVYRLSPEPTSYAIGADLWL